MLSSKLEESTSNKLYSSTVGDNRKPSSSIYDKRNTFVMPNTPPATNYLTTNYTTNFRNNRKD